ncbi:MAG: DUF2799 domain-containing protein [Maricaulaceae bacterium]
MINTKTISSILVPLFIAAASFSLSACHSISEESCVTGNWEAIGFKDGSKGKAPGKTADYAKRCAKFDSIVDQAAYQSGYNAGLPSYCTFERGYERGVSGSSYKQVCSGELAADYAPGYDEGRVVYEIYQQHGEMVERHEDVSVALYEVRRKLAEDELVDNDRKRLRKKAKRLKYRLEDLRVDIRVFERLHDIPRVDLGRI